MNSNRDAVRATQTDITLETYAYGPPDPNPRFPEGRRVDVYPYPMLDDPGETHAPRAYQALVLENRYLRLTVLPELGGHLYSAYDKTAGREIFYRNNVVKPGLVALRGAWISGGVEFNFPIGHSMTTVSPVDWRLESHPDGSATIWVGDLERVSRMQWWVGITLRPGVAAFETRVLLHNRTPLRRRYYFWTNTAVKATEGLQFICPMQYRKVGEHIAPYPFDEGKDLSWYRNHDHAVDLFAHQVREDWFGWYDHREDAGLVHVANAPECLGKKFFTWGAADDGLIWAKLLSEDDGPYCEVQSGRFEDQSTWRFLQPFSVESWGETWYPVGGAGAFVAANQDAALALRSVDGRLQAGVYATRPLADVTLEARAGEEILLRAPVTAAPGKPFTVLLPEDTGAEIVSLALLNARGQALLRSQPRPATSPVPPAPPAPPDTAETRYLAGVRAEQAYHPEEAAEHYRRALALDPEYAPALCGLAVVALWQGWWADAAAYCERALAREPDNAEARYYRGYAALRLGDTATARFHLGQAQRVPAFAGAARALLGQAALQAGDWEAALTALSFPGADPKTRALAAAARRHAGTPDEAFLNLPAPGSAFEWGEAWLTARALHGEGAEADLLRRAWHAQLRGEPEAYLEAAHDYASAGLREDALTLLEEGIAHCEPQPLLFYTQGALYAQMGRAAEAAAAYRRGREAPGTGCFPHRWESADALRRAITQDPEDARARLYLGTLLYARGRRGEALACWQEAACLEPGNPVLRRNLGYAAWQAGELDAAARHYDAAMAADPAEFHRYLERDRIAEARGETAAERLDRLEQAPEAVRRRGDVAARRAALNNRLGRFDAAIAILAAHHFYPWEGALGMRRVYLDAHVGRGLALLAAEHAEAALAAFREALQYPRNVAVGCPARPNDAEPLALAGCAAARCGKDAEAAAFWEQAAAEVHPQPSEAWFYQGIALARLGRAEEARARFEGLALAARERLAQAPEDIGAHYRLGLAYIGLGEAERGQAEMTAVLEADPGHFRAGFFRETALL